MAIEVGQEAPDFELVNQHGQPVKLSQFRGDKNVLLIFYPFAFSGLCTGELCEVRDRYEDFSGDDVVTLAVSCDPMFSLKAYAEAEGLRHDLLSDFWPHGEVAQAYGAFLPEKGMATRASFVIDKDGIVRWAVVNGPGEVRSTADYRAALDALAA